MRQTFEISGNIVDVLNRRIYRGQLQVQNGLIKNIVPSEEESEIYILPGFIDAHVHIESSLLPPSTFSSLALKHGVIAAICDPHEIANVCGAMGVKYMIENGSKTPFQFYFGAPSCVPATNLETSGFVLSSSDIDSLFKDRDVYFLSEMMNFPGVVNSDDEVLRKIDVAKKYNKPIDGHAPGLTGFQLNQYISAGISTDHECTTVDEAREKINGGMKVLIRNGSAAKNLRDLAPLFLEYPDMIMLCTDDIHADDLIDGYINLLVKELVAMGYDLFDILRATNYNIARHYGIKFSFLEIGDTADFIICNNLKDFNVEEVFINGEKCKNFKSQQKVETINNFSRYCIDEKDLEVFRRSDSMNTIEIIDKQIITRPYLYKLKNKDNLVQSIPDDDILKIVVCNRYENTPPACAFVKGFGIKKGAIASSISHDSHNIIAIGVSDYDIVQAINEVVLAQGGICYFSDTVTILKLPIAGLMSNENPEKVVELYHCIENGLKSAGCNLKAPLMNLSFLSLLVIPELKLSDRGLFSFQKFSYIDLFV